MTSTCGGEAGSIPFGRGRVTTPGRCIEEAYEVVNGAVAGSRVVLTCEHASNRLPKPWSWPADDLWITNTHWAYDIGAAEITRGLAQELGVVAILARFSRLLVDTNRAVPKPGMFRAQAEGRRVLLNVDLKPDDQLARLNDYYRPYHQRLDQEISLAPEAMVLAIHSFTPDYEGQKRWMDVGLLFYKDEDLAVQIGEQFRAAGLKVGLNEPYSGANGEMYSAYRHGTKHGRRALELEFCQALSGDATQREKLTRLTARALGAVGVVKLPSS